MSGLGDALGYLAGSIDKPGRAVRGALAGKPREALAALPFSDTLGLTDPADRVSGRDLTDAYGLTRKGDNGWGAWGLGFGADLATDPLSMLPMGLAGKAAHGAGLFDQAGMAAKAFAHDASGVARISLPGHRLSTAIDAGLVSAHDTPWRQALAQADRFGVQAQHYTPDGMAAFIAENGLDPAILHEAPAFFKGNQFGGVGLNGAMPVWDKPAEMNQFLEQNLGHFSSAAPNTLVNHEIGHSLHEAHGGADLYDRLGTLGMKPEETEVVNRLVSGYGSTSPREAVAEIVGPLLSGQSFHEGRLVAQPLRKYGGKHLYQYLGDHGYLKGLGLSSLGMLSSRLASMTHPEATNAG